MRRPSFTLGIPIDDVTMDEAIDEIDRLVAHGRQTGRCHQIATVNVDFLVNALDHEELHRLLQNTSLNVADGEPIVWASKAAGLPLRERVAGADLIPRLVAEASSRRWHIHFFGSGPGVGDRAVDVLLDRYPGTRLTSESGPMITDVNEVGEADLRALADVNADIVCVALGNPKQERFIAAHGHRLGVPVMIGIGGTLDMLIGDRKRAPAWVQRIGAEWIVRAFQEPRRLGGRYLRDARIFVPRQLRYLRRLRRTEGSPLTVSDAEGVLRVSTDPTERGRPVAGCDLRRLVAAATRVEVGLPRPPDVEGIADLIGITRTARRLGVPVEVCSIADEVADRLDDLRLPLWTAGHGSAA